MGDTVVLDADYAASAAEIIGNLYPVLSKCKEGDGPKKIVDIMDACKNHNLRSLIFACQKAADLFAVIQNLENFPDAGFMDAVFYGILSYALRQRNGQLQEWDDSDVLSCAWGFPLFRFRYDYIAHQSIYPHASAIAATAFAKFRQYDPRSTSDDPDL